MPGYYDVDAILAEEELLAVRPNFDFDRLAHLDPDSHRLAASSSGRKRSHAEAGGDATKETSAAGNSVGHRLPKGTKVKMPLWAVEKWATLGFVRVPNLPRHYRRRMEERLQADPVTMNLCNKNEHYFLSGTLLSNLLLRSTRAFFRSNRRPSPNDDAAMSNLANQARSLRRSLLSTMMGERLCRNFDWTLSALDSVEDDVSEWVARLSVLERRMFDKGVEASGAVRGWREHGCGRMGVSMAAIKGRGFGVRTGLTPSNGGNGRGEKKRVVTPVGSATGRSF